MANIDLSKLSPEPWVASTDGYDHHWCVSVNGWLFAGISHHPDSGLATDDDIHEEADANFIALARRAFGIMMRRGWWVVPVGDGTWQVRTEDDKTEADILLKGKVDATDPFTVLCIAEDWWIANIEKGPSK